MGAESEAGIFLGPETVSTGERNSLMRVEVGQQASLKADQ